MDVGIIGLGRMGFGVASRLLRGGHAVHVYNRTREKGEPLEKEGAVIAGSLEELVAALPAPRVVWLYLPAGQVTAEHLGVLEHLLQPGDTVIDGGNSRYHASIQTGTRLTEKGIVYLDVGTSGGVAGKEVGYCLMIGGDKATYQRLEPLWQSVAQENGFQRAGALGAGHFVKMVHNAIEYGMMQSYAEGMELMESEKETLSLDIPEVAELWQHGSIIRSFLGGLLSASLKEDANLSSMSGAIGDNGEGKWAIEEALNRGIAMPAITASLYARYSSRRSATIGQKTINALRNKFGGHAIGK